MTDKHQMKCNFCDSPNLKLWIVEGDDAIDVYSCDNIICAFLKAFPKGEGPTGMKSHIRIECDGDRITSKYIIPYSNFKA